jgi:hypothetical protein
MAWAVASRISQWTMALAVVLDLAGTGCLPRSPTVTVEDSCVADGGYACDWMAALERAEAGDCDESLAGHWSAAVRQACREPDGVIDIGIRFWNNDVHFDQSSPAQESKLGKVIDPLYQDAHLREFNFGPGYTVPALTSSHGVSAIARTRVGVLVGIDHGEWGGGLVWLRDRGDPEVLFRGPVQRIFEWEGRVYMVADDYFFRGELYELQRRGSERSATWDIRLRFRLPGRLVELRSLDDELLLVTDAGTVAVGRAGDLRVLPRAGSTE